MADWSILKLSSLASGLRIDPEYYQPRYLADAERLQLFNLRTIGSMAVVTDGIHGSPDEVDEGGVRYLSAKCVKDNDFSLGDTLRISDTQHDANPRTKLRLDDVLITTVGTIGNAAVVQPDILPANSDRHLGIVRLREGAPVDSYFVSAFLNSEFGKFQSLRESTGNVQLNLFIEKIRELQIPILKCAAKVSAKVREAYAERFAATAKIAEAEALIVTSLGFSGLDLTPTKTYTQKLSTMLASQRFGAEYYMPAKQRAVDALAGGKSSHPLSTYVENVREMWSPNQCAPGEMVRNFDLSHAMEPFLDGRQDAIEGAGIGSAKKRLRAGDVVISRLRSYLKQIAVVRCGSKPPCVGSSEFIVLRPTGDLSAETLLAFLRCKPVQTILQWSQDGTNHPRFDERELMSVPVPDSILKVQPSMNAAVSDAIAARQAMLKRLSEARQMIESEIQGPAAAQ